MRYEVHIDTQTSVCKVVEGTDRRTFMSTPRAVGLALLSSGERESAASEVRDITWQDMLPTHGVAVGTRGSQVITLAIIPARQRTIRLSTPDYTGDLNVTFPSILIAMNMQAGRFVRGGLFVPDLSRQAQMAVLNSPPVLAGFPWGNVYTSGRICWGTVATRDIRNLRDLEDLFFNSGFNADLFTSGVAGGPSLRSVARAHDNILPAPEAGSTRAYTITIPGAVSLVLRGES